MKIQPWTMTAVVLPLVVLLLPQAARAEGDPQGERNLATTGDLPQGAGLAAAYPGDADIAAHGDVIFADNFEQGELGAEWDSIRNDKQRVLSLTGQVSEGAPVGRRSLQVTARLSENTGGGLTKWFASSPQLFIRFYTRFDPACDYVHHFCTLRANKGLQGGDRWSGFGGAGDCPAGDVRFSTALEPWGDWERLTPPGRWNFYTYWHEMTKSGDGRYWGNAFRPASQPDIPRGQWICAEFMVQHNTPGKADGGQAFWIDGKLLGHWQGINWRTSPTLWANAFTLESYITDRWTKHEENTVYFDNVVVSKAYIGPAGEER